ncbi:MAG: urate hydroxylase PuuD [Bacteriovoracia bacterium]
MFTLDAHWGEWLNLIFRWLHLIAGISWIGSSFYFMWLDSHIAAPENKDDPAKENVAGELWMVHSGGFYLVQKRYLAPGQVPPVLHWFKWEATFTWITGFCLLAIVYYLSGGAYLVDTGISSISAGAATVLGIGLLVVGWFAYDLFWAHAFKNHAKLGAAISFAALCGIAYYLCHTLSGRAAYLHVGALMGTLMMVNVWVRILPAQSAMIAATQAGKKADYSLGVRAKMRSIHNNYMTFPVLFIMLSNHFPSTYGHPYNWTILIGLMLAGAGVRHFLNVKTVFSRFAFAASLATVVGLFMYTAPRAANFDGGHASNPTTPATVSAPTGASGNGTVSGTVTFAGKIPEPQPIMLPPGCVPPNGKPPTSTTVLAQDGKLKNVFLAVTRGLESQTYPVPEKEVIVDQKGCIYDPHVIGAQVGQKVVFLNSDPVFHNVRTLGGTNPTFNEMMPSQGMRMTKIFSEPEIMVRAKCDVHPWMSSFIGVVPHPYFAVSDGKGGFRIASLPDGNYTLTAWHESLGTQTQEFQISGGASATIDFNFVGK